VSVVQADRLREAGCTADLWAVSVVQADRLREAGCTADFKPQRISNHSGFQTGPMATTVLCPPKPKELERVGPGSQERTSRTMSLRGISGS